MAWTTEQKSKLYGLAQTTLMIFFAVAVFFGPDTPILPNGRISWIISNVFCTAGIVLLLVAISHIGQSIQIAPEPKKTATLVTTGVYRWFRHPIYTSIVIMVVGLFLRKPAAAVGIAGTIVIIFLLVKVKFEEKLLQARYPEYSAYMHRSMGILPWPHRSTR
jgi:protein-S-isoprenylcysteine O-methyltransferase Ste14